MTSSLLVFSLLVSAIFMLTIDGLQCPYDSQWNLRAVGMCNIAQRYHCLYDENKMQYTEFCRNYPDFEAAGFKMVVVGSLQGKHCDMNRFQPFKFWTNGSSACTYLKSKSSDIGQIIFDNGSYKKDISCRCDYTEGFDFVARPNSPCVCIPSEEDCSCYYKRCPTGSILTPDYNCVATMNWKTTFECPLIKRTQVTPDATSSSPDRLSDVKSSNESRNSILWILKNMIIIVCVMLMTGIIIIFYLIDISDRESEMWEHTKDDLRLSEISELEMWDNTQNDMMLSDMNENTDTENIWEAKLEMFVFTNATKQIIECISQEQCLLITGAFGSGKSVNAFQAAIHLKKMNDYMIIPVQTVADIDRNIQQNVKQLFLIDDIIETLPFRETIVKVCSKITNILASHENVKIIMTSRSPIYILNSFKREDIPFVHCDLLSDVLQVSLGERKEIFTKYLGNNLLNEIDDDSLMLYSFFPSLCSMAAKDLPKHVADFFMYPFEFLAIEFNNMREKSDVSFLALALLIVKDNNVERELFNAANCQSDKLLKDVFTESGFKQCPSKSLLLDTFKSLTGTFVLENETRFICIHETLFSIISTCIGTFFISSILEHGDMNFILERVKLKGFDHSHERCIISLSPDLGISYFERIISFIKAGHIWKVFQNTENQIPVYRNKLISFMEGRVKVNTITDIEDNATVLHVVSSLGYTDYFGYFLRTDLPDVNAIDNKQRSALHIASISGRLPFVNMLLQSKSNVSLQDQDGRTALHLACISGHQNIVTSLVHAAAPVNAKDDQGITPLHLACGTGHYEIVKTLIHCKADIDSSDDYDMTPLHVACRESKEDIVKLLLKHKANVIKVNKDGFSPLHSACMNGNETICGMLCSKRANFNQRASQSAETPLGIACHNGYLKVAEVLLTWGADVNIVSNGLTPLDTSVQAGHNKISDLLLKNGAKIKGDKQLPYDTTMQKL